MSESDIQKYQEAKRDHETMKRNIKCFFSQSDEIEMSKAYLTDSEPDRGFRMWFTAWSRNKNSQYESSHDQRHTSRMADYLIKVVNSMMPVILEKAS